MGKTDYDLYAPDMAEKYRADDRRIMESSGTEKIEETYRTPAGKDLLSARSRPPSKMNVDRSPESWGSSPTSPRAIAKESIAGKRNQFCGLFRDSVIGMAVVSPNYELVQVSPAFCEFLGYSEQELIGRTVQSITYPEDREETVRVIYRAPNSGPRVLRVEKRYLHKSGQVLWGEATLHARVRCRRQTPLLHRRCGHRRAKTGRRGVEEGPRRT